ncbi:cytochrome P450 [Choiromyces venosus 120613-1]|uniref:Cytochrome P450 n=1 Tax=Choiromyces venosus 120613-1 TaxID=1336337 RepID=A0A3N4JG25_9PEZI|nr:cytochrome P450 [Choiromyces venosus 120613-1]
MPSLMVILAPIFKSVFIRTFAQILPLALLAIVASCVYSRYASPLKKVPGPVLASFSRIWLNVGLVARGDLHGGILDAHRKYGPVVRVGPNKVYFSDPALILEIYGAGTKYRKSDLYMMSDPEPGHGSTFSERSAAKHAELRRRVGPAYSNSAVLQMESYIDTLVSAWIHALSSEFTAAKTSFKSCDFARWSQFLTYDVISELAFGKAFGFIATRSDYKQYIASMQQALPIIVTMSYFEELVKLMTLGWVRKFTIPSIKDETGYGNLTKTARELVSERWAKGGVGERRDMLQRFYEQGMTEKEAMVDSTLILVAGSDSTATAIRAAVMFICSNPGVYTTLKSELATNLTRTNPPSVVSFSIARKLPYLSACIKESLRLFPPGAGAMERVVPAGGATLNGYFIPENTVVCIHPWPVCRDEVFGEDVDSFRPERWLEEKDEKRLAKMEKTLDFVFGAGPHYCLGKQIAYVELYKSVAELFLTFDIGLSNPTQPWKSREYGFFLQRDMMVNIKRVDG